MIEVWVSTTEDCGDNIGGYYCQVYDDKYYENEIDNFCIHADELEQNPDIDYWIRENCNGYYKVMN